MIRLELFDYTKYNKTNIEVTRYVNDNLASIIRVALDMLNDNCGFEMDNFLPRDYIERKPEEARRLVDELYELIKSDVLRDYIQPKYEYLLYIIIDWWDQCIDSEEELIPNPLDKNLYTKIINEESYSEENYSELIIAKITNFQSYYYICFIDHDFLPDQLSKMVTIYLRNQELLKGFFPDVNLDDYEDFMPCDLRERYIESKNNNLIEQNTDNIINQEQIILEILFVLTLLESRVVEIEKRDEVEISNDIYTAITRVLKCRFDLESTREMTIGRANVKLGETDLYIYKNTPYIREEYAIIENKYIENFKSQYQQLLGYLNANFKFGITIFINKKYKLMDCVKKIKDVLISMKDTDKDFKIVNISTPFSDYPYISVSSHIIPEDTDREMKIYHLILNLYDEQRNKIAKISRI